jgi:hypothetical protein
VVVIADGAGDLPGSIFELPEMDELAFSVSDLGVSGMVEAMHAGFEQAVSLHVKNLQRTRDEFARGIATDVLLHAFGQGRGAERNASLIVVELYVVDKERLEFLQIAFVAGISAVSRAAPTRSSSCWFWILSSSAMDCAWESDANKRAASRDRKSMGPR